MNLRTLVVRAVKSFLRAADLQEEDLPSPTTPTPPAVEEETLWPLPSPSLITVSEMSAEPTDNSDEEGTETILTIESTVTGDMTTQKDSGMTVTIPNDEIITITMHTTVLTDKPPPLPTSFSSDSPTSSLAISEGSTSGVTPSSTPGGNDSVPVSANGTGTLSTGAIIGVGVGGAALIALIVLLVFIAKRRAKNRREAQQAAAMEDEIGRDDLVEEKHFPNTMSAQTTGTHRNADPFAPFGGRADVSDSEYPNRPPSNVFEMDATSIAPVELPAINTTGNPTTNSSGVSGQRRAFRVDTGARDPKATLNSLGNEDGKPKYVNHWEQYKAMGSN